jgi:hypothetical protein
MTALKFDAVQCSDFSNLRKLKLGKQSNPR